MSAANSLPAWRWALALCVAAAQASCQRPEPKAPLSLDSERARPSRGAAAQQAPAANAVPSASAPADGEHEEHADELDDSGETDELLAAAETGAAPPHPLDGWSDERIWATLQSDLPSLGSMSVGSANAGSLINGVQAVESALYRPVSPSGSWATQETLDYLTRSLAKVHEEFPDTPPLALGDISGQQGGSARPHLSHQSGRDVDIAYFYKDSGRWYARGTAKNLDLPRTWAFVRALLSETDVDLILIDRSIQTLLEQYALAAGEDPAWLSGVFKGVPGRLRPIIRHAPGHATHIHIRFFNPLAQETGRRCFELLLRAKLAQPAQGYVSHRVKKNETLAMIAKKYGTTVARLRAANGLKSTLIREKRLLTIPVARRGPTQRPERLRIPERRIPPARREL